MAREKDDFSRPTNTVIGKNLTVKAAQITGSDSIRVDGTIIGNIELDGTLQLSETGRIEGDIKVVSTRIAGHVKGNITCRSMLHLASTAVIIGDIVTASFVVDEGAVLQGLCKTNSNDSQMESTVCP